MNEGLETGAHPEPNPKGLNPEVLKSSPPIEQMTLREQTPATAPSLEIVREEISATQQEEKPSSPKGRQRPRLWGDFTGTPLDDTGRIVLPKETMYEVTGKVAEHERKYSSSLPSILLGAPTATEYQGSAANFSTRTGIITLEDGRRVFVIYDYPLSSIHRFLDGLATHGAGDRMAKASKKEWKDRVEAKSNIPVIAYDQAHTVLLPYIENVNAHDAFALNKEIGVSEKFNWVKNLSLEDKIQLGEAVIRELAIVHAEGKTWGETILHNMIITKDKEIIIVDPETAYDTDVDPTEQRARDLRDAVFSIAGALHTSESLSDYGALVKRLLNQYPDKAVIQSLEEVVSKPLSLTQKFFTLIHEIVRLGVSLSEMKKLAQEIAAY